MFKKIGMIYLLTTNKSDDAKHAKFMMESFIESTRCCQKAGVDPFDELNIDNRLLRLCSHDFSLAAPVA